MQTRLLVLFLSALPLFSAYAACPTTNSYPFTANCPLPAAELNSAIGDRLQISTLSTTDLATSTLVAQVPSSTLADGASWAVKVNGLSANLDAASGNQFVQVIQGGVNAATGAGGDYERGGLLVQSYTKDPSSSHDLDIVGIDSRGVIKSPNTQGRAWGLYTRGEVEASADGYALGAEIQVVNNATADQASLDTTTSKYLVHLVPGGSQKSTAGIYVTGGGANSTVHQGIYIKRAAIHTDSGDRAIQVGTPAGTEYFGVTRDGDINGTSVSLANSFASPLTTTQTALNVSSTFAPAGASLTNLNGTLSSPTLNSTNYTLTTAKAFDAGLTLGASFTGVVTNAYGYSAQDFSASAGKITNARQYNAAALTNGNGLTTGSVLNRQFHAAGITAGVAGGTANNRTVEISVPSGGASSGTANNYGLYITGNGGTASGGTVNNFALISDSTAQSLFVGNVNYRGATNLFGNAAGAPAHITTAQTTAPVLTSCGTSPAIAGTDTAGLVTMGTTATGCIITFNVAYTSTPYCVVSWIDTPLASQSYVTSNTAITLTQTSTSNNKVQYICIGQTS